MHQRFVAWAFCSAAGWIFASWMFRACCRLCLACLGSGDESAVECVDLTMPACKPCHVCREKGRTLFLFPFSGWVRPQQSTRGESIYRPIGRRNVKNAPGPESACGWGCWVFWGLRLADDQRLQNQAAPLFRYSLSLHVALTAAWSKPAMFRQISLLSIVVKIKLFINHVESNDTLNQMCWARITKCSLLTAHKNVWLMCMVKAFGSVKIDRFNKCKTFSDIE